MTSVAKTENPNISYSVSPAHPLPFPNTSMDIITVSAAFHHFEEPQRFVNECMRVLCDDGRLYIGEFSYSAAARILLNLLLPLLKSGDVRLYSERELIGFFIRAGFKVFDVVSADRCVVLSFKKAV